MEARAQPQVKTLPLQFTGNAVEFFQIWITNLFLTIATIGVYSAWAKVRDKRYFYGNTLLDGVPFEYLADPIVILKGRLLAVAVIVVYAVAATFYPLSEPLFGLAFLLVLPWIIVRALAFNAQNSAYRNIRFSHHGGYLAAFGTFILLPMLSLLSLGLLLPYFTCQRARFMVANYRFGGSRFSLLAGAGPFYLLYLKLLFAIAVLFVFVGLVAAVMPPLAIVAGVAGFFAAAGNADSMATNLIWNHVEIDGNRFECDLSGPALGWLYLGNALGILFSFGLLIPWARIRLARYRLEHLWLNATDELAGFIARRQERIAAAGEELGDLLDIDFAL
jgi:uncharacterized membrane protein YjgN (DUF898 family)